MSKFVLLGLAVLAVLVVWAVLKLKAGAWGIYYLRPALFTAAERAFLDALEHSLPPGVRVFGKVRLADIFGVKRGLKAADRQGAFNRIGRKHVDFLLARREDLAPLAGIELDDQSHAQEDRRQRDAFVDSVFADAGLPLLHVPVQHAYDPSELKARIVRLLAERKSGPPTGRSGT